MSGKTILHRLDNRLDICEIQVKVNDSLIVYENTLHDSKAYTRA